MARNSNGKSFALGAFLGGVVGGVAALLFAPKAGKHLRKDITDKYCEVSEKAQCLMEDVCDQTQELVEKAKNLADDAKDCASKFMKKRR